MDVPLWLAVLLIGCGVMVGLPIGAEWARSIDRRWQERIDALRGQHRTDAE